MLGKMNDNIAIKTRTIITDAEGFQTETVSNVWSGRAFVNRKSANKAWVSSASFADATDLFVIRKPTMSIKTNMVIEYNSNEYEILSVKLVEKMYLEIMAKVVIASGQI